MSDIPPDIVSDFLSRVPAQCLLRFRCVSKSWRAIIDSPGFIKMHLNRTIQTNSDRKLILRSCYLFSADFDELEKTNKAVYTKLDHPFKSSDFGTDILGSCHGLLCLDTGDKDSIVLWNPTTREHLKIPFSEFEFSGDTLFYTRSVVYGFGYDKVSGDYKVLRILQSDDGESEVKVFSVKSKSWRKIRCFPYYLKYKRAHGVLAAGAFHWVVSRNPDSEMENLIAAFDLGTEEYRLVPQPEYPKKGFHMDVGVLGESLCLFCNYYDSKYVDIWVMKNYAMKESWTKLFTVAESNVRLKPLKHVIPVAYSKSGRHVLMVQNDKQLLWYDLEKRKIRSSTFCISSMPNIMEHEMCFGSLVRLDGGNSGSVGRVVDRKQTMGSQGTKKKAKRREMVSCLRASSWCFNPSWLIAMGWFRKKWPTDKMQNARDSERSDTGESGHGSGLSVFRVGQRVHYAGNSRRIGSVKYIGPVEGYSGTWIGVDWDKGEGKHDGCHNGVRYFEAAGSTTASFVRPHNLSVGIPLLQALELRYRTASSKEEEDEMYVFSASNKRVTVELLGKEKIQNKLSHFEELTSASLSYLGVSAAGDPSHISTTIPNLKELDLTGNLLSEWEDVGIICKELPALAALNLSHNIMAHDISGMPLLKNIRILVLNHTGISWKHVEILKDSFPFIEELHLVGNKLKEITPSSSVFVKGFDSLRLLNLDDNCIDSWDEILKLSQLRSLEQLFMNHNNLSCIWYPDHDTLHETLNGDECLGKSSKPFKNLHSLLLGNNNIKDVESVDSLNYFPNLLEVRLSENPVTDPGKCGLSRFVLVARLAGVKILNGSEVSPRERKESEIRYVRLVMSKCHEYPQEIDRLHPRFAELKRYHGIEDEKPQSGATGPQKMAAGLISITMKCIGASIGEKPPLTKKLPVTTTVGKLKNLCESFFKIRSIKPKLFLQEAGAPFPTLLDDDMATLLDAGVGNESTILVDDE